MNVQSNWIPEFPQSLLISLISLSVINSSDLTHLNTFSLDRSIGNVEKKTVFVRCSLSSPSEAPILTRLENAQSTDYLASQPYPGKKTSGVGR